MLKKFSAIVLVLLIIAAADSCKSNKISCPAYGSKKGSSDMTGQMPAKYGKARLSIAPPGYKGN